MKREGYSDARVASITNKEYDFAVLFSKRFIKSIKLISDEWLNAICFRCRFFRAFMRAIIFWRSKVRLPNENRRNI